MAYSKQNEAVSNDKFQFFTQLHDKQFKNLGDLERRADGLGYSFLLENQKALEAEFSQMFAVLERQRDKNNKAFWIYCYYCATLLENFYKAYSHQAKEKEYKDAKAEIKKHIVKKQEETKKKAKEEAKKEDDFIESLKKSFAKGFENLWTAPAHLSRIRDYVAYANLCRVYWVFCRLTLTTGFTLAKELQILEKLDAILGTHTDAQKIIDFIKAPNGVLNYFSVGLFLMRFAIDFGHLVRHTWFPTEAEEKDKTTALERFKFELYKRHCNFANDLVWATVNFITNFNHITHIPDPTAGIITAIFLGFDVCMTLYKCHLAKQEYLTKKEQYDNELRELKKHPEKFKGLDIEQHKKMLELQLKELEIGWQTKQATFYFTAAAAALLMLGFTASLLFTGPGIAVACFFVCTLAVAMYLSSDAYSKLQEKSLRLDDAKSTGKDLQFALKEYEAAYNDFIFTMVKNTVMPTLIIATFAVCWPAAIVLTALYLGYEIYHAYDQHKSKKEAQLALEKPDEDGSIIEGTVVYKDEAIEVNERSCCFA
ncbi:MULTISPECIES: hypothetical protein [Legionella]|uniref:hypothetical protein n=1 Tax=Legionella TaxID=445 RepID=UPI000962923F|nr:MULTISPECIES: hypothetical protein [Legionella]MBN9228696.1 hypothetical protein [Legionella steelei]OJW08638.1 MAG: hypothetical protein BGO44_15945 [Legionella sp. 39-23]